MIGLATIFARFPPDATKDVRDVYARAIVKVCWWDAYLAVLPTLVAQNPDGNHSAKAARIAVAAVEEYDTMCRNEETGA